MSSSSVAAPAAPRAPGAGAVETTAAAIGRVLAWVAFFAVYVFLYAPLVTIIAFSFNDSEAQSLPFAGFTTSWYGDLLDDEQIHEALRQSLIVAAGTVAIALVAGTAFAFIFDRVRSRTATVVQSALTLPFLLPGMVLGLSLAITFNAAGVAPGRLTIMVGHATFVMPVVMLIVLARLRRIDPSYAQASMDCGANRLRTFWHVTLPQLRTALIVAVPARLHALVRRGDRDVLPGRHRRRRCRSSSGTRSASASRPRSTPSSA